MPNSVSELFDLAEKARQAYANDEIGTTPVGIFIHAYRLFSDALARSPEDRFEPAARFLKELDERVGELDDDEDAPGVWRLWENARLVVDRYDRVQAQKNATKDEGTNANETKDEENAVVSLADYVPAEENAEAETTNETTIDDETAKKIDEQIDAGTPARQVAATLGVDVDDVKRRATKRRAKE